MIKGRKGMENKEVKSAYYEVYVKSFVDFNKDGFGDLRGLRSKFSIIAQLGINYIVLRDVFDKNEGKDLFYKLNPLYGDDKSLEELSEKAKKFRLKIILDIKSADLLEAFGKENLLENLGKILDFYHEKKIKGIRLRDVDLLKKTYGEDFEKVLGSIKKKANDLDMLFLGEVMDERIIKDSDLLDMAYISKANSLIKKNSYGDFYGLLDRLEKSRMQDGIYYGIDYNNLAYPRLIERLLSDEDSTEALAKALAILIFTQSTIPFIYQGEEIEARSEYEINIGSISDETIKKAYENFLADGFDEEEAKEKIKNETNFSAKIPIRWDDSKFGGFSDIENYYGEMVNLDNNFKKYLKDADSFFFFVHDMIMLRKRESAFGLGDYERLILDESVYAYKKTYKDKSFMVIVNLTDDFYLIEEDLVAILEKGEVLINNNRDFDPEVLDAYQALVLKL